MATEKKYGSKYDAELDVTEIAKRIRADIKAAGLPGKFSVRISRYSGGQSITISTSVPFAVRVPDVESENAGRAAGLLQPWLTRPAHELYTKLEAIGEAYNYDGSDTMTDYFDVNFYLHVNVDEAPIVAAERSNRPEGFHL